MKSFHFRMVNFMHYTDTSIRPLPGFNVLLGHNGSGKSAIVNAICIGLGGSIDTLQRCDNIATFVRRGAEEAKIEITLYNGNGEDHLVTCVISKKGKVIWSLNGARTQKSSVEALMAGLNIQTGNMCQFLPQDVVKNFPLMTAHDRFLSTVRAVGEGGLVDDFDSLKDIQKAIDDADALLATKERTQQDMKAKLEALKGKKTRIDFVEQKQLEKELVNKKLMWVRFENDIKDTKKIKKNVDDVKARVEALRTKVKTLEKVDGEKEGKLAAVASKLVQPEKMGKQQQKLVTDSPVERKIRELEHLDELLATEEESRHDREKKVADVRNEIEKLTRELGQQSPEQELELLISKLRDKELQLDNKLQTLIASRTDLTSKGRILSRQLGETEKRLKSLRSAEQQKLQQLGKSNPDCYKAVLYVRQHMPEWREKGRFKYGVHEPALLTLRLQDMEQAVYVEKEAGTQQLEAFVCEAATEANDLMQELRARFSKVSVIHGDLSKMHQFVGPKGERWRQRPPMDQLGRHSFVAYVSDMFQGPEAVKVHLFMHTSVFSTAVFGPDSSSEQITESFPDLRKYYLGKKLNTCRKSKYSGLISRGEEDISYYKAQKLRVCADQDEINVQEKQVIAEMKTQQVLNLFPFQVEELKLEIQTNSKQLQTVSDTVEENKKEMKAVKTEIQQIQESKVQKQKLEITLKHKQELVEQLVQPTNAIFHETRMIEFREKRKDATKALAALMTKMAEEQGKGMIQAMEKEMLYMQQFHLTQVYSENSSQLASLRSELGEQEAALLPAEVRLDQWKNQLRISKDAAHGCTADEVTDVPIAKKPPPGYAAKFETIEAKTQEQLEAQLEHLESELQSEQKTMKDQAKVLQRYDELEKGLVAVEAEVESLTEVRGSKVVEREAISTTGVRKVQELINKVSAKFGDYFAELGYSGEVTLSRADEMDFKSYGVAIKVRFRAGEEWSELAKGRQSGGEMSVTTAVYMLALQVGDC